MTTFFVSVRSNEPNGAATQVVASLHKSESEPEPEPESS